MKELNRRFSFQNPYKERIRMKIDVEKKQPNRMEWNEMKEEAIEALPLKCKLLHEG